VPPPADLFPHDHNRSSIHNASRRQLFGGSDCGWWWCGKKLGRQDRSDLLKALKILTDHGIDPQGLDVISVALANVESEQLAAAREALERFDQAARDLLSTLWPNGAPQKLARYAVGRVKLVGGGEQYAILEERDDPYTVLTSAIRTFEPLIERARKLRPNGQHAATKIGPRAALAKGGEFKQIAATAKDGVKRPAWPVEARAAALRLTIRNSNYLDNLIMNLRRMASRPPKKDANRPRRSAASK
jgi:hypothetical protein